MEPSLRSHRLIDRSPDLRRLRDEGYDIDIKGTYLLLKNVPYVNSNREIKLGMLVSELTMAGDVTSMPGTHVLYFAGDFPCHKDGSEISQLKHQSQTNDLGNGVMVNHSFSNRPPQGYANYYEKMTGYVEIISAPAHSLDASASARRYPVLAIGDSDSVFKYFDSASSRAGISAIAHKLELSRIAIVGLGGTGSYILDLVAKTTVKEIHLFDGDTFLNHNAFRSPGAASLEQLGQRTKKASYFARQYDPMRRAIFAHDFFIDASNVESLRGMDFVFLAFEKASDKRSVVESLLEWGIQFIDVGIGVEKVDDSLVGMVRVTTGTKEKQDHLLKRIQLVDDNLVGEYPNIQVADLNALNAALAVIKWKKLYGFYLDFENEYDSIYTIGTNTLSNQDKRCDENKG